MKITIKGNTNKGNELRKVRNGEREDSVLSFWVAEDIKKRDGSTETQWSQVTVWRGYAETIARLLGSESRKVMVTGYGKAKCKPTKTGQIVAYVDIQADDVDFLDDKRPEQVPPEVVEAAAGTTNFVAVETEIPF